MRAATNFDVHVFWHYLFDSYILQGAKLTVELTVLCQGAGIILGLFAALGRLSTRKFPIFRWLAGFYIWLFRGTPLLVQLIFVYFALPQLTNGRIVLTEFMSAFIALSLNEGAYMSEIIRAGISSVDAGQMEAAESLGMTRGLAMRRIVIPQAIRIIIPPTGNELISMLKNTSLASVIGATELLYQAQQIYSGSATGALGSQRYFELIAVTAVWYLAMTTVATYLQGHLERYFERGFTRDVREPGLMRRVMAGAARRA